MVRRFPARLQAGQAGLVVPVEISEAVNSDRTSLAFVPGITLTAVKVTVVISRHGRSTVKSRGLQTHRMRA
jgi:hypothetical protein